MHIRCARHYNATVHLRSTNTVLKVTSVYYYGRIKAQQLLIEDIFKGFTGAEPIVCCKVVYGEISMLNQNASWTFNGLTHGEEVGDQVWTTPPDSFNKISRLTSLVERDSTWKLAESSFLLGGRTRSRNFVSNFIVRGGGKVLIPGSNDAV